MERAGRQYPSHRPLSDDFRPIATAAPTLGGLCGVVGFMTFFLSLALAAAPATWGELELSPSLRRVLDKGSFSNTPKGFRAIALSHLADGCRFQAEHFPERRAAARRCIGTAYVRSLDLLSPVCTLQACHLERLLSDVNPLALSHLLLVMGDADAVGECLDSNLHRALADELAKQSAGDPFGTLPSFRGSAMRWPADQSALLAGLQRADRAHGTNVLAAPLSRFVLALEKHGLHSSGLPKSELTGVGAGADIPRGCAQSFISRYFAEVDPERSAAWWSIYKSHFFVELPMKVAGFREWPPGVSGRADSDSGPIILGIGTAASALGISAAKAQGDSVLARRLEDSAEIAEQVGVATALESATFAEAVRFEGRWHPITKP